MRKLAMAALAFSGAVFLSYYLLPMEWTAWVMGAFLLPGLGSLIFKGEWPLRVRLICLGFAAGLLVCGLSFALKTAPARELDGKEASFEAELTEYPIEGDSYTSLTVKLRDKSLPRVKARIYCYYMDVPQMEPGDRIRVTAKLRYAGERYGELWDGYTSDGVYLLCYPKEDIELVGKSPLSFVHFPQKISRAVKSSVLECCGDEAPFITALLTGDKHLLYEDTELYINMSRAGILHVVAVSGMHVAFLVGLLQVFIRKQKIASIVGIPLLWVFAAVAGWTPSVVRAAFMYTMVLAAPLFDRESDSITSLSAILAILLLINPDACASVSLQLSFSAVAGMLFITPRVYEGLTVPLNRKRKGKKLDESKLIKSVYGIYYAAAGSVSATIGAIALSTPLTAIYFGALSTYGVLSNILVFWAVSACFVLGYIAAFAGMIFPLLGKIIGFPAVLLAKYVKCAVNLVGGFRFSQIWVDEGYFLFWLISLYLIFILWAFFRRGKSFRPTVPLCLAVSLLLVGVISSEISVRSAPPTFTAADVGQGQSLILSEKGRAIVIDCGGKGTTTNAGDTVSSLLQKRGINRIDALCLTHFDDDHINGVERLMYQIPVERLIIAPEDADDTDRDKIIGIAEKLGIETYIITEDTLIELNSITLTAYRPLSKSEPMLIFHAKSGDADILITGDAYDDMEYRLMLSRALPDMDIFIAGHHGSAYSSSEELLGAINAETAVISCGWNSYGHPSDEALARFDQAGMDVLRTDELGTIDIILSEVK